jgi:chromosome segregation ATPase
MSNLLSLFNQPNYQELENELENANNKIDSLNIKIEFLEKNLEEISKRLNDIEEGYKKDKENTNNIIIDIFKYYKSSTYFGKISLNNALDMIYKRFVNYTFTEKDKEKYINIIHLDYEELPERVALRKHEKNVFTQI